MGQHTNSASQYRHKQNKLLMLTPVPIKGLNYGIIVLYTN
jgi:hypothetical protein